MIGELIRDLDLLEKLAVMLDSTHHYVKNWKHLALVLGISSSDIESLKRPVISTSPTRQLIEHLCVSDSNTTVRQLIKVLKKDRRNDVVATLENLTGNCSHSLINQCSMTSVSNQ